MKSNKIYFILGLPSVLILMLIIYGYVKPIQNEPIKISLVDFKKEINSKENVLVYFHASWCVVCSKMKPIIDNVELEYKSIKVLRINTDNNKVVADEFEVNSLPLIILYHNGNVVFKEIGAMSSVELKLKLDYLK